jgi:DNA-binding response OmpR family regulator
MSRSRDAIQQMSPRDRLPIEPSEARIDKLRLTDARLRTGFTRAEVSSLVSTSAMPLRILVVDDPTMTQMIVNYLRAQDMRAVSASGRQEAVRLFLTEAEPDLMILDLRLGQEDGLDLLRELRSRSDAPAARQVAPERESERSRCRFGGWQLDRRTRRLTDPNGSPVWLTKGEYALLIAFIEAPQRSLTREHLLRATRVHEDVFDRSIDVQVLRLRRKLKTNPGSSQIILTERGVGYVFALPVERL